MTLKKYRGEFLSLKPIVIKDRERKCLRCSVQFRTDKTSFMCHQCREFATRNGDYGI
jgi:Zn finger protein HypA/HybF involved in hydrogenase expression